jgi:ankyrin repeat protein
MQALYGGDQQGAAAIRAASPGLEVFEAAALGDLEELRARLDEDSSGISAWSDVVERGADLEGPSRNEQFALEARPLHSALAARQKEVAVVLLDAGAEVNAREHQGPTPLHEAAQHGDVELVRLLLERGADPSARLDHGRTAADLADLAAGRPDVLALLS